VSIRSFPDTRIIQPVFDGHKSVAYDEHLKQVNEKKAELEKALEKTLSFLRSQEMINMLKEEKLFNMSYIKSNFSVDDKQLELLFEYAKFLYECGQYPGIKVNRESIDAINYLLFYRRLSNNREKNISALWGQLGSYLMLEIHEKAYETFIKLKDYIDSMVTAYN